MLHILYGQVTYNIKDNQCIFHINKDNLFVKKTNLQSKQYILPNKNNFISTKNFLFFFFKLNKETYVYSAILCLFMCYITIFVVANINNIIKFILGFFAKDILTLLNKKFDSAALPAVTGEMIDNEKNINIALGKNRTKNILQSIYFWINQKNIENINNYTKILLEEYEDDDIKEYARNIQENVYNADDINYNVDKFITSTNNIINKYPNISIFHNILMYLEKLQQDLKVNKKETMEFFKNYDASKHKQAVGSMTSFVLRFLSINFGHETIIDQFDMLGAELSASIINFIYPIVVGSNSLDGLYDYFDIRFDNIDENTFSQPEAKFLHIENMTNAGMLKEAFNNTLTNEAPCISDILFQYHNQDNGDQNSQLKKIKEFILEYTQDLHNKISEINQGKKTPNNALAKYPHLLIENFQFFAPIIENIETIVNDDNINSIGQLLEKINLYINKIFIEAKVNNYYTDFFIHSQNIDNDNIKIQEIVNKRYINTELYKMFMGIFELYDILGEKPNIKNNKVMNMLFNVFYIKKYMLDNIRSVNDKFNGLLKKRGFITKELSEFHLYNIFHVPTNKFSEYLLINDLKKKYKVVPSQYMNILINLVFYVSIIGKYVKEQNVIDQLYEKIVKFIDNNNYTEFSLKHHTPNYLNHTFDTINEYTDNIFQTKYNILHNEVIDIVQNIHDTNNSQIQFVKSSLTNILDDYAKYISNKVTLEFLKSKINSLNSENVLFDHIVNSNKKNNDTLIDLYTESEIESIVNKLSKFYKPHIKSQSFLQKLFNKRENYSNDEVSLFTPKDSRTILNILHIIEQNKPLSHDMRNNINTLKYTIEDDIKKHNFNEHQNLAQYIKTLYDYSEYSINILLGSFVSTRDKFINAMLFFPYFQFMIIIGIVQILKQIIYRRIQENIKYIKQKTELVLTDYVMDTVEDKNIFFPLKSLANDMEIFTSNIINNFIVLTELLMIGITLYNKEKLRGIIGYIMLTVIGYITLSMIIQICTLSINEQLQLEVKESNDLLENIAIKPVIQFLNIKKEIIAKKEKINKEQLLCKQKTHTQVLIEYVLYLTSVIIILTLILNVSLENNLFDTSKNIIDTLYFIVFFLLLKYDTIPYQLVENFLLYKKINRNREIIGQLNTIDNVGIQPYDLQGDIHMKNMSFKYKHGKEIFKNVNCSLKKNKIYAIIGFSGEGKSTFINLLLNYIKPTEGSIFLEKNNINNFHTFKYLSQIAFVPQKTSYLRNTSIINNIRDSNPNITETQIINLLKLCDLNKFIDRDKIRTPIGFGGNTLSGGECQRLLIARALAKLPLSDMFILDEPFASIDHRACVNLVALLQKCFNQNKMNKTIFIIDHSGNALKLTNDVIFINNGQIIVSTHEELKKNNSIYKEYFH